MLLRKKVGMVFQQPTPFPMSIYDNVAYGPRSHGIRRKEILDEIVEQALQDAFLYGEVRDGLKRPAGGLSGVSAGGPGTVRRRGPGRGPGLYGAVPGEAGF